MITCIVHECFIESFELVILNKRNKKKDEVNSDAGEKSMILEEIKKFKTITVQCHDNPDADAIASGFAIYTYLKAIGKEVELIYSGRFEISKPNLMEMVKQLNIPIQFVKEYVPKELLVTVDCQYGAGNVTKFEAKTVAIIDHHQIEINDVPLFDIRQSLGSCSTLIWSLIMEDSFSLANYENVSTALYYGLFSDTNSFAEIEHPLDKDMRDALEYDKSLLAKLRNSNLLLKDIETAGIALLHCSYNAQDNFSVFRAQPCDPNILGFISDLALQVNIIDTCVVFNETDHGIKFSVRSCIREVMASELASYLSDTIGSGGGHKEKAGGYILSKKFHTKYPELDVDTYFLNRIREYYDSFDFVYSNNHKLDISKMKVYKKKPILLGFVSTTDIYPEGTPILIRTLEGDVDIKVSNQIYLMIGKRGEVYPIKKEKFQSSYMISDQPLNLQIDYKPHIKNQNTGDIVELKTFSSTCIPTGDVRIYAKQTTRATKVFTNWDKEGYMLGKLGDYIAVRTNDFQDVYIIDKEIFYETYEEVTE